MNCLRCAVFAAAGLVPTLSIAQSVPLKFDFGPGRVQKGFVQVLPEAVYSKEKSYGFSPGAVLTATNRKKGNALEQDFVSSNKAFSFSVNLPDGNYDVKATFGDKNGTSSQTVRAECRRFMLETFNTGKGKTVKRNFTVHMRSMDIGSAGKKVLINPREVGFLHWDNLLTFEFNGKDIKLCALEITRNDKAINVFLAGNSTVVDQDQEPWGAWGQMIPVFFKPGKVSIANYAESGETYLAFKREQRLEKIWSMARPGDYLFMEFAHNDQKAGVNHLDPFTTYKATIKEWAAEAISKGLHPVIITSMGRKADTKDKEPNSLGDYPEAARQAGKEAGIPIIDLNGMSRQMYSAWGSADVGKAFVDGTHANIYGAWQLAKCIVEGIRTQVPALAKHLKPGLKPFDPSHPDPVTLLDWPPSSRFSTVKPPGS